MMESWRAILIVLAFGLFSLGSQEKDAIWPTITGSVFLFIGLAKL